MLGLYLYTLIISHKFYKMLSTLKQITLQKDLQNFVTNSVLWTTRKSTTTTKQKIKHENPGRSWESNPGPLAPKTDALQLHHRVN